MNQRRRSVVTAIAGVLAVGGAMAIFLTLAAQQHAPQPPGIATGAPFTPAAGVSVLPPSPPLVISIPAIGLRSDLQYLGLTPDNRLEVPAGAHYDEAAWYKYSSTPGSLGPAVILGHVDSPTGPSVFFDLGEVRPGDEIHVTRADGIVAIFRVDEIHSYPKLQFPTLLVYGATDHAALRLVTCGGGYDRSTGQYLENVIVFASMVEF